MTTQLRRPDLSSHIGMDAIVEQARGSPVALANVARTLVLSKGAADRALMLADQALAMAPGDGEVRAIHAEVFSADVGSWYFPMVLDAQRHAAYARAMRRALAGGGRVLEIGAGTGLFAMMAARAGADQVVACERRPAVAAAAKQVVADNGLQDRVKIVAKPSADLAIGVDLAGPADVLIWDNLANDLLSAGALPAIEDAIRRLIKPGATIIPARCAIKAALAEDRNWRRRRMARAEAFDLSAFNKLAKPVYTMTCDSEDLVIRSNSAVLFDFDFRSGGPFPAGKTLRPVTGNGGPANGVVQWLTFQLDDDEIYDPSPGAPAIAFGLEFHPSQAAFEVELGATYAIGASHDRDHLRVWLEDT